MNKFKNAFKGLSHALKDSSILLQLGLGTLALAVVLLYKVNKQDFIYILLCSGLVVVSEMFNTCIERVCDLITIENNEKVKYIKDLAAGTVLFACIVAVVVGIIVMYPYIIESLIWR